MTDQRRRYSAEQRSEAVGLAISVGVKETGRRLGIPYRTVSHWLARPDAKVAIASTQEAILATLRAGAAEGAATLVAIIRNPKADDRDKVRASEVLIDRWNLLSGGVTGRTQAENLNVNLERVMDPDELDEAAAYLRHLQARLDAGDPTAITEGEAYFADVTRYTDVG